MSLIAAVFGVLGAGALVGGGVLFRHQRILTYVASACVLASIEWLSITLLHRLLWPAADAAWFYLIGALVWLLIWAFGIKAWRLPYVGMTGSGKRDVWVLLVMILALGAAYMVVSVNGFSQHEWTSHGFYNGDTATLGTLVQRSMISEGLLRENPFAGNGYLEYPTLLHGGIATLFDLLGLDERWLYFLPAITLLQLAVIVPIFFLLWDVVMPEPEDAWRLWLGVPSRFAVYGVQALIVLYVMAVAWDNYIYPQSHFFLTSLFLFLVAVLYMWQARRNLTQLPYYILGSLVAIILLFANAVMGAAAVALMICASAWAAADKKRAVSERAVSAALVPIFAAVFLLVGSGDASFGWPHFSYVAAGDMVRWAPVVLGLAVAAILMMPRYTFLSAGVAVMVVIAGFTFFFSTRPIIIDNAGRFIYHGLLIGFPLLLAPLIQLWYFAKRQLIYSSRTLVEGFVGWVLVLALLSAAWLPAAQSVASSHDHLMYRDEQHVGLPWRDALWWIERRTPADSVFLAAPNPPFSIPFFTGRTLLRTNYWLSPDDEILRNVNLAYNGDKDAQLAMIRLADYVVLTTAELSSWGNSPEVMRELGEKVFFNPTLVIYKPGQ